MDEAVAKTLRVLLSAGWKGVALALLVALLYGILRVYAPKIRFPELPPGTPQEPADENGLQPQGQPLPTDEDHPGGDIPNGA